MPLNYRRGGTNYVVYYYNSTSDINSSDAVGYITVRVGGSNRYIGYGSTSSSESSFINVRIGGTTYALLQRSKQQTIVRNSGTWTQESTVTASYTLRGGGEGGVAGGGGGGGAVASQWTISGNLIDVTCAGGGGGGSRQSSPENAQAVNSGTVVLTQGTSYTLSTGTVGDGEDGGSGGSADKVIENSSLATGSNPSGEGMPREAQDSSANNGGNGSLGDPGGSSILRITASSTIATSGTISRQGQLNADGGLSSSISQDSNNATSGAGGSGNGNDGFTGTTAECDGCGGSDRTATGGNGGSPGGGAGGGARFRQSDGPTGNNTCAQTMPSDIVDCIEADNGTSGLNGLNGTVTGPNEVSYTILVDGF